MRIKSKRALHCPSTGQKCIYDTVIFEREITIKTHPDGSVKATVCMHACAERWAETKGRVMVSEYLTSKRGRKRRTRRTIIVRHTFSET